MNQAAFAVVAAGVVVGLALGVGAFLRAREGRLDLTRELRNVLWALLALGAVVAVFAFGEVGPSVVLPTVLVLGGAYVAAGRDPRVRAIGPYRAVGLLAVALGCLGLVGALLRFLASRG